MEPFPALPLESWADSKETLHRFAQIVGKIRLAASPRRNHWWNVPLHLTGRGLTTRPMGGTDGNPIFAIDFDLVDHRLLVTSEAGRTVSFPLAGQSVASFYRQVFEALRILGIEVSIRPVPFDLPGPPFAEDTGHASYDPQAVNRYWQVLGRVNLLLEEYAAQFAGKTSPVHHFWHTLDIAVTRFSDRVVEQPPSADPVTREAYSREVISSGFWFGDASVPEPAFYSYTAPEPDGLADEPLRPATATWLPSRGSHLAVLRYDDARATADPRATALDFLASAYEAGARRARWDTAALACPDGVTDPLARPRRAATGVGGPPAG
ncbi:MAG TPA: DUF5996 family protein [Mycobacteriales bacterium]|nr:DUF5996 family protein [Mycobacteriales bacterium]